MRNNPGSKLEKYIAQKLRKIGDTNARITRGSGNHTEIGDINSNWFYIECKEKHSKKNIIMDYNKDYLKLINNMPTKSLKEAFVVIENSMRERFVVMGVEAFFRIISKGEDNA